ncbi:thermonuclease family protein [Neptunomonas antarctica]|nr:thermonuclease family protein [Neptunomonas antarctica]
MSAFFVSVISPVMLPVLASDNCVSGLKKEKIAIRYVYDGDTVQLSDRRKVRLAGLNTPELKAGVGWSRAIAKDAKSFLEHWLNVRQGGVFLQIEQETHDSYGRVLGYLVDAKGKGPGVDLLKKGLGYAIAIAPNLEKQKCYFAAEQKARLAGVGVWSFDSIVLAKNITRKHSGFLVVEGEITHQYHFKTSDALVLNNHLVVMLRKAPRMSELMGKKIRVRGWVHAKKFTRDGFSADFSLYLNHSANIDVL